MEDPSPLFADRPEWSDVSPLEQYTSDIKPLAPIIYTPQCKPQPFLSLLLNFIKNPPDRDAADYFRGIVKSGEKSLRVLELTERLIRLNPAHYTAWSVPPPPPLSMPPPLTKTPLQAIPLRNPPLPPPPNHHHHEPSGKPPNIQRTNPPRRSIHPILEDLSSMASPSSHRLSHQTLEGRVGVYQKDFRRRVGGGCEELSYVELSTVDFGVFRC